MQIRASIDATQRAITKLRQPQAAYYEYRLKRLSGVAPVSGSSYHDGTLTSALNQAMSRWKELVELDVRKLNGIYLTISSADQSAARKRG